MCRSGWPRRADRGGGWRPGGGPEVPGNADVGEPVAAGTGRWRPAGAGLQRARRCPVQAQPGRIRGRRHFDSIKLEKLPERVCTRCERRANGHVNPLVEGSAASLRAAQSSRSGARRVSHPTRPQPALTAAQPAAAAVGRYRSGRSSPHHKRRRGHAGAPESGTRALGRAPARPRTAPHRPARISRPCEPQLPRFAGN